eukprot:GHVN01002148.1.p1 GENE.GHVN01002148.1~~GHVN01002148.1.p1  ORF type:complete len:620 (-),score=58.15 GHVN01002148.1:521-2380(-)
MRGWTFQNDVPNAQLDHWKGQDSWDELGKVNNGNTQRTLWNTVESSWEGGVNVHELRCFLSDFVQHSVSREPCCNTPTNPNMVNSTDWNYLSSLYEQPRTTGMSPPLDEFSHSVNSDSNSTLVADLHPSVDRQLSLSPSFLPVDTVSLATADEAHLEHSEARKCQTSDLSSTSAPTKAAVRCSPKKSPLAVVSPCEPQPTIQQSVEKTAMIVWVSRVPATINNDHILDGLNDVLQSAGRALRIIGTSCSTFHGNLIYVLLDSELAVSQLMKSKEHSFGKILRIPPTHKLFVHTVTQLVIESMEEEKTFVPSKLSPPEMMEAYLRGTLCLGCDLVDHPLTKCPNATFVCPNCHKNDHRGGECSKPCRFCFRVHSGVNITRCIKNASREVKRLLENSKSFEINTDEGKLCQPNGDGRAAIEHQNSSRPDDSFGRSIWISPISDDVSCEAIEKAINTLCPSGGVVSITRRTDQKWVSVEMDSLQAAHHVVYTNLVVSGRQLKVQFKKVHKETAQSWVPLTPPTPRANRPGTNEAASNPFTQMGEPIRSIMSMQCSPGALSGHRAEELANLESQLKACLSVCAQFQKSCNQWIVEGREELLRRRSKQSPSRVRNSHNGFSVDF